MCKICRSDWFAQEKGRQFPDSLIFIVCTVCIFEEKYLKNCVQYVGVFPFKGSLGEKAKLFDKPVFFNCR